MCSIVVDQCHRLGSAVSIGTQLVFGLSKHLAGQVEADDRPVKVGDREQRLGQAARARGHVQDQRAVDAVQQV